MQSVEFPLKLTTSSRKLIPLIKQKLREKVPLLTSNEIKRVKKPLHEALLDELDEETFPQGHSFFDEIIQHDLKGSKLLTSNKELLERIFKDLKFCEKAFNIKKIQIYVKLARHIQEVNEKLSWTIDKIFRCAVEFIQIYRLKDSSLDIICKYFYGKFLNKSQKSYEDAVKNLSAAHNAMKLVKSVEEFKDIQFMLTDDFNSNLLKTFIKHELFDALINFADDIRQDNPIKAIDLAEIALKLIEFDRKNFKMVFKYHMTMGKCFLILKTFELAGNHFEDAFEVAIKQNFHVEAVESLIMLSEYYARLNDDENYEKTLKKAKNLAKEFSLEKIESDICMTLGEFWSNKKNYQKSVKYFNRSIEIFKKHDDLINARKCQIMIAAPLAALSFNDIVNCIRKSAEATPGNNRHLSHLILWYDRKYSVVNPYHDSYQDSPDDVE